jgi:hypothetical protein
MPQGWTSSAVEGEPVMFKPLDDLDQHAALRDENVMTAMFPGSDRVERELTLHKWKSSIHSIADQMNSCTEKKRLRR